MQATDPQLLASFIKLIDKYRRECACWGDQYGSWGPCDRCKEAFELLAVAEKK